MNKAALGALGAGAALAVGIELIAIGAADADLSPARLAIFTGLGFALGLPGIMRAKADKATMERDGR